MIYDKIKLAAATLWLSYTVNVIDDCCNNICMHENIYHKTHMGKLDMLDRKMSIEHFFIIIDNKQQKP